jgi:integrase/recombinase XerC
MYDIKMLVQEFKDYLGKQDLSKSTIRNYSSDIENFIHWYDDQHGEEVKVNQITAYHLDFFREQMLKAKRLKVASVNRKIQTLKRFFGFLIRKKIIKTNVAAAIKFIRKTKATRPQALTKAETHALLSVAGQSAHGLSSRNYAIIQLIMQTGLRVSEVIGLQWRDLSLYERSGMVRIVDGKGHKERIIPLGSSIRKALTAYKGSREVGQMTPVFLNKQGKVATARALQKMITGLARRAKINRIKVTPNVLRHTFATNYLRANPGCLVELATLLGHESIETTAIYTKASAERLEETLDKAQLSL